MNFLTPSKAARLLLLTMMLLHAARGQSEHKKPCLEQRGETIQLIVDGKPMLLLAGELGNSTSSSIEALDQALDKCVQLGLNSAITVISWDQFEAVEGQYDYTLIDGMIQSAAKHDLKLVVIWFASFKNGTMTYAPEWVKNDTLRFPRVLGPDSETLKTDTADTSDTPLLNHYILSPFFEATWWADANAFAALMKRIRETDQEQTVVMVQVENEAGTFGVAMDQQPRALKRFNQPVPKILMDYLHTESARLVPSMTKALKENGNRTHGTWRDVFGSQAVDAFMAWHVASFMEQVTAAGKAEYDIPMFYNAWLKQPNAKGVPGRYPTGGPIHTMLDVYRAASPSIDILSPDVYFPAFKQYCEAYTHPGNVLFIPECHNNQEAIAKAYWTIAEKQGLGCAPFRVEHMPIGSSITDGYAVLEQLSPCILEAQTSGRLRGLYKQPVPKNEDLKTEAWDFNAGGLPLGDGTSTTVTFDPWTFKVEYTDTLENVPAYGLMLQLSNDEFLVTGKNLNISFWHNNPSKETRLIHAQQGSYNDKVWTVRRQLNGDETNHGQRLTLPSAGDALAPTDRQDILKFKLHAYPKSPTTTPGPKT
jgi:hypothetical protein